MSNREVFEPAVCCATGLCGVDVDPTSVQFSDHLQAVSAAPTSASKKTPPIL
ncbi:arsenic metallochaperone ArsD family protein [Paraburkholderia bryophila]|uniref:Arsenical resistance operon trans-acting repressor ArsD n=1 Tax=Paraburkholderia bryophila TaxID=420952 RepID=A0A7Z0B769_9BURK|nr:arsenic metallochaperone ArsD family protein [Paraburkholderia bryophila]NYH24201.1 hypothetical protein [Paraburkholderia bryophila]